MLPNSPNTPAAADSLIYCVIFSSIRLIVDFTISLQLKNYQIRERELVKKIRHLFLYGGLSLFVTFIVLCWLNNSCSESVT